MRERAPILAALAVCFTGLWLGLHEGELWGDDFAQYIMHARNIATGAPYAESGYLYGIGAFLGPRVYPPLYPLVLAPLYFFFGLNVVAFKLAGVLSVVGALWCWASIVRRHFNPWVTAGWIVVVGLHPATREFTDHVLSDPLFLFWCAAALLAIEQAGSPVVTGLTMAAATLTRAAGLALLPIPAMVDVVRRRRLSRSGLASIAIAGLVTVAGNVVVPGQVSYLEAPSLPIQLRALRWTQLYAADFVSVLPGIGEKRGDELLAAARTMVGREPQITGIEDASAIAIAAAIGLAAIMAVGLASTEFPLAATLFAACYLAMLVVHGDYGGDRLFWPLLPIVYLAFLMGLKRCAERFRLQTLPAAGLAIAIALNFTMVTVRPYTTESDPFQDAGARAFLAFVRDSTPPDAVVIFPKPRALALLTGRRGLAAGNTSTERVDAIVQASGATYLVSAPFESDRVAEYAREHAATYVRVYAADGYEVFARAVN